MLEGEYDRGLIWHTQGSGKSLTMLFAARKLVNIGLENPTVFVVIDRVNLDGPDRRRQPGLEERRLRARICAGCSWVTAAA